jgi:hypothetical protein
MTVGTMKNDGAKESFASLSLSSFVGYSLLALQNVDGMDWN